MGAERQLRDLRLEPGQRYRQRQFERRLAGEVLFRILDPRSTSDPNAPTLVRTEDALATLFAWFNANGGTNRPNVGADVPGVNTRVAPDLASPSVDEFAAGVTKRLGPRALVRVDGVYRKYEDFYATRIDQSTGQVVNELGDPFDVVITQNTNDVQRQYAGLNLSGSWRPGERTTIGVGYTLSRTWGNVDGETSASGPVPTTILSTRVSRIRAGPSRSAI